MYKYIYKYIYVCCSFEKENVKQFFLVRLPFAHRANGDRRFVVCPFAYEVTNGKYRLQTN
jgi:hypothetical protein